MLSTCDHTTPKHVIMRCCCGYMWVTTSLPLYKRPRSNADTGTVVAIQPHNALRAWRAILPCYRFQDFTFETLGTTTRLIRAQQSGDKPVACCMEPCIPTSAFASQITSPGQWPGRAADSAECPPSPQHRTPPCRRPAQRTAAAPPSNRDRPGH